MCVKTAQQLVQLVHPQPLVKHVQMVTWVQPYVLVIRVTRFLDRVVFSVSLLAQLVRDLLQIVQHVLEPIEAPLHVLAILDIIIIVELAHYALHLALHALLPPFVQLARTLRWQSIQECAPVQMEHGIITRFALLVHHPVVTVHQLQYAWLALHLIWLYHQELALAILVMYGYQVVVRLVLLLVLIVLQQPQIVPLAQILTWH